MKLHRTTITFYPYPALIPSIHVIFLIHSIIPTIKMFINTLFVHIKSWTFNHKISDLEKTEPYSEKYKNEEKITTNLIN